MARRRGRNSGNNNSLLFLIIIGILIYLLFPRLQLNQEQNKSQNQSNETNLNTSNSENQAQYDIVVFVVGNTENSPAPKLADNKNISATLENLFYSTEAGELPNIVLFSATAEPKTIEIEKKYFLGQAANELASQSNFNDLLKGIELAANSSPSCSGADYFAAIIEALEYVKSYDNPLIIVYGSGLSDTGVINFAFDNLIKL